MRLSHVPTACVRTPRSRSPLSCSFPAAAEMLRRRPEQTDEKPKVATSQVERGPVRMSVTVDPSPARLSDEPTLTLEIAYAQGITVHKPEFGSALGEFIIRDFREPLPRVEGDRQILQQIYTLEPTRAGKIRDRSDQHHLHRQPGRRRGQGAHARDRADHRRGGRRRRPGGPVAGPVARAGRPAAVAAVVRRGAGGGLPRRGGRGRCLPRPWRGGCRRKRMRSGRLRHARRTGQPGIAAIAGERPRRPRREAVLRRADGHRPPLHRADQGHPRPRADDAGVPAGDQPPQGFPAEQSRRLRSFLEAADLVKFAAHQPREEDIEESFRRAKAFVGCADREEVAA